MARQQVHAKIGEKGVPLRQKAGLGRSPILRDRPSFRQLRLHTLADLHKDAVHQQPIPRVACARVAVLGRLPARRASRAVSSSTTGLSVQLGRGMPPVLVFVLSGRAR